MAIDIDGNLYAAAGLLRRRGTHETLDTKCGVYVISPQGKLLRMIPIPEDTITNTAFVIMPGGSVDMTCGPQNHAVTVEFMPEKNAKLGTAGVVRTIRFNSE